MGWVTSTQRKKIEGLWTIFFKNVPKTSGFLGKTKVSSKAYKEKKLKGWYVSVTLKNGLGSNRKNPLSKKAPILSKYTFCCLFNKNNVLSSKVTQTKTCTKVVKEGFRKRFPWPILISCYAIISLHKPSKTCWRHDRFSFCCQYQKRKKNQLYWREELPFLFFSYPRETPLLKPQVHFALSNSVFFSIFAWMFIVKNWICTVAHETCCNSPKFWTGARSTVALQHLLSEACTEHWPETKQFFCQIFRLKSRLLVGTLLDLNLVVLEVNELENQEMFWLFLFWSFPGCQWCDRNKRFMTFFVNTTLKHLCWLRLQQIFWSR